MKRLLIFSAVSALLIGCSSHDGKYAPPKFAHVNKDVSFEYVTEDLPFALVSDFCVCNDVIAITAYNRTDENYLHIYDVNTGRHMSSGIRHGSGPGETLHPEYTYFDSAEKVFCFYNSNTKSNMAFGFDGGVQLLDENYFETARWATHTFPLNDETYITMTCTSPRAIMDSGDPRIFINTCYLDTLATYDDYPFEESMERFMQYSYHGLADISPDRKHLAIGLGIGCVLETFEISSEIKCTGLKYFIKPEMPITGSNGELNYDNTIWGFGDIELSDNYIYTAYDGKKENKMHNNIAVFDLTGEPVSITCLGNNDIHRLYADEPNGNLYAAIETEVGEIRIIVIKIDDILPEK